MSSRSGGRDLAIYTVAWLALLALTLATWRAADGAGLAGLSIATLALGVATLKGLLIAAVFMEMAHSDRRWLALMAVFLVGLALGLGLLFARSAGERAPEAYARRLATVTSDGTPKATTTALRSTSQSSGER